MSWRRRNRIRVTKYPRGRGERKSCGGRVSLALLCVSGVQKFDVHHCCFLFLKKGKKKGGKDCRISFDPVCHFIIPFYPSLIGVSLEYLCTYTRSRVVAKVSLERKLNNKRELPLAIFRGWFLLKVQTSPSMFVFVYFLTKGVSKNRGHSKTLWIPGKKFAAASNTIWLQKTSNQEITLTRNNFLRIIICWLV